jgi:hypothetical protein
MVLLMCVLFIGIIVSIVRFMVLFIGIIVYGIVYLYYCLWYCLSVLLFLLLGLWFYYCVFIITSVCFHHNPVLSSFISLVSHARRVTLVKNCD